jgi:hypothetical protein
VQELAIHVMNNFKSYHDVPLIYFCEYCRVFGSFYKEKCQNNNKWLYWNEKHGMIPSDYCYTTLAESKKPP